MSLNDKEIHVQVLPPKLNQDGELNPSAVKITHRKTKKTVTVDMGESVEDNKQKAIQLLTAILSSDRSSLTR